MYGDFHYQINTAVVKPFLNKNTFTGKTTSLYWDGPVYKFLTTHCRGVLSIMQHWFSIANNKAHCTHEKWNRSYWPHCQYSVSGVSIALPVTCWINYHVPFRIWCIMWIIDVFVLCLVFARIVLSFLIGFVWHKNPYASGLVHLQWDNNIITPIASDLTLRCIGAPNHNKTQHTATCLYSSDDVRSGCTISYTDPAWLSLTNDENLLISNSKLASDSELIWYR